MPDVPRRWRSLCTLTMRSVSSYCVITSLFTTATMRSSRSTRAAASERVPCASAAPLAASARMARQILISDIVACSVVEIDLSFGLLAGGGDVDPLIARDVALQRFERIGPETGETVQRELQEHARGGGARRKGEALYHDASGPAVGSVFEPPDALDDAAVGQRILEPSHAVPASEERPLRGQVYLLGRSVLSDVPAKVAIAEVDRLESLGSVPSRQRQALRAEVALVVLGACVHGPGVGQAP